MTQVARFLPGVLTTLVVLVLCTAAAADGVDIEAIRAAIRETGARWTAGETSVSDLSPEEMRVLCGGLRESGQAESAAPQERPPDVRQVPVEFDWRGHNGSNWMTSVKSQGGCGSCWAFASLGALEAMTRIVTGRALTAIDLSEQYMLSCSDGGCVGWTLGGTLGFLEDAGTPDEACMAYQTSDTVPCDDACDDSDRRLMQVLEWEWVGGDFGVQSVNEIKEAILDGPVPTWMNVFEDFQAYTDGVYEHTWGDVVGGHFVVIVGWSDAGDYWICKNSWGTGWGIGGYFRIAMGSNEVGIEENTASLDPKLVYVLAPADDNPANVGPIDNPNNFQAEVRVGPYGALYNGLSSDAFETVVGQWDGTVVTAVERENAYDLNVAPPDDDDGVSAPGLYDLEVTVDDEEFTQDHIEADAVLYSDSAAVPVDIMIVLDRSGSMGSYGYMEPAKTAAQQFVEFMELDDMTGVGSFSSSSTVNYPLTLITSEAIKDAAQAAISTISSGGMTSLGSGLLVGQTELEASGQMADSWAIIFLSDGYQTEGITIYDVLPGMPDKIDVYTIAMGTNSDENLLEYVATYTGGSYFIAPTTSELQDIYNLIRGQVTQEQTVATGGGTVEEGQTGSSAAYVDDTMTEMVFLASWTDGDLDLTLERPDGSAVDPAVAASDTGITYVEESTYEYYKIVSPAVGEWDLLVYGDDVVGASEAYGTTVSGKSDLDLESCFFADDYYLNEPVGILASLLEGSTPLIGAEVTVTVTPPYMCKREWIEANGDLMPPEWSRTGRDTTELCLYDDGNHGDGAEDDGVYGNYYTGASSEGTYVFDFGASGQTAGGSHFTRLTQGSIYLEWPGTYGWIDGTVSYNGSADEGDLRVRAWRDDPYMGGTPNHLVVIEDVDCPEDYSFEYLPDGTYYVDAFLDVDGDAGWDPATEPWGMYGAPDGVTLEGYSGADSIDIVLEDPAVPPFKVYPNPFRGGDEAHTNIVFEGLPSDSDVEIYTLSGELVVDGTADNDQSWTWDVKNAEGEDVARGVYFFIVSPPSGDKETGKLAVIRE